MADYIVFYKTTLVSCTKKYPENEIGKPWATDHNKEKVLFGAVEQCVVEAHSEADAQAQFDKINEAYSEGLFCTDDFGNPYNINSVGSGVFLKAIKV